MAFYREPYDYKKFPVVSYLAALKRAILTSQTKDAIYLSLRMYEFSYAQGYKVVNNANLGKKWTGTIVKRKLCSFLRKFVVEEIGTAALGCLPLVDQYLEYLEKDEPERFYLRVKALISLVGLLCAQPKSRLPSWGEKHKREDVKKLVDILCCFAEKPFNFRFKCAKYLTEQIWPLYLLVCEEKYMKILHKWGGYEALTLATLSIILCGKVNHDYVLHKEDFCAKREIERSLVPRIIIE